MSRFLLVGDLHYAGVNPKNYISDYKDDFRTQMNEVFGLATAHGVNAILTPGDIFNTHTVAISTMLELRDILMKSPVPWCMIPGNHDLTGYNVSSFFRSSAVVLNALLPWHLCTVGDYEEAGQSPDNSQIESRQPVILEESPGGFLTRDTDITGTWYSSRMDVDGYGYDPGYLSAEEYLSINGEMETEQRFKIHMSHGMLLDHHPGIDIKYTHIRDVKTTADVLLNGHLHNGMPLYFKSGSSVIDCGDHHEWALGSGVLVCNPGAFMRQEASKTEITRKIRVGLVEFESSRCKASLIPLSSAKEGHEVLSRDAIEASEERAYAMSKFTALIQAASGEAVAADSLETLRLIGESKGFPREVVEKAIELVTERRGGIESH